MRRHWPFARPAGLVNSPTAPAFQALTPVVEIAYSIVSFDFADRGLPRLR